MLRADDEDRADAMAMLVGDLRTAKRKLDA